MFKEKLKNLPAEIQDMFAQLQSIVLSVCPAAEQRLWAGLPSYYNGSAVVRLIPFKDHINIEAAALLDFKAALSDCKFTPKNMLQINIGQPIPTDVLAGVFAKTLVG